MKKPIIKDFGTSIETLFEAIWFAMGNEEDGKEKYMQLYGDLYNFYKDHKEIEKEVR